MTNPTKTVHRAVASLKLPNKVPAMITYAQGIVKAVTGNPAFPAAAPTLPAVTQAIADLQTAETAALARTKGAVAVRNEKRAALIKLLQEVRGSIQTVADASPPARCSWSRTPPSLLVVDDDADHRAALDRLLSQEGFRVTWCSNGREALDCLRTERPDLILLDLKMPVTDGLEFRAAQKKDPALSRAFQSSP